MAENVDLSKMFQAVTQQLAQKKDTLNEADSYNHDHGDHMVQIFSLIQDAVAKKSEKPVSEQLDYAREIVEKQAQSGSGKLYAEGLSKASENLSGKDLNQNTISTLVKSLLSADQPAQPKEEPTQGGGLLGNLLSGLTGGSESSESDQGIGLDDLLSAGMAFYQSKQEGDSNTEAIMDALMSASPMGQSSYRTQSGSIVASTIMEFAKSFTK